LLTYHLYSNNLASIYSSLNTEHIDKESLQKISINMRQFRTPFSIEETHNEHHSKEFNEETAKINKGSSVIVPHIGTIEEAEEWLIDNHYILSGYRIGFSKIKHTIMSLFMIHNETTNIWSHLCGVIMFVIFVFYVIFFVGGFSLTKPLDVVIDKFEHKSFNKCDMQEDL